MAVDDTDVGRMARLARIRIESDAMPGYAADLSRILDLVAQMEAADTSGVE
ncbi:MAG: aspartyl/glutamyl-tRNA amidotransferase subunit C, partial [Gammaproteobacteria bacterium]|nr:aspartyl/glutamyl-tRNA amidotransferase subunit C [Gammaproteobacteria bacterium]